MAKVVRVRQDVEADDEIERAARGRIDFNQRIDMSVEKSNVGHALAHAALPCLGRFESPSLSAVPPRKVLARLSILTPKVQESIELCAALPLEVVIPIAQSCLVVVLKDSGPPIIRRRILRVTIARTKQF